MRSDSDSTPPSPTLAPRTGDIGRSSIRKMFDRAQQFDGSALVHLEMVEPDFNTPGHIVEAALTAVANGPTHYTSNAGLPGLRRTIADDLAAPYDPDPEVIVTAGTMETFPLAIMTIVDPGYEVYKDLTDNGEFDSVADVTDCRQNVVTVSEGFDRIEAFLETEVVQ